MNDNELGRIKSDGLFGRLPNLSKLDLRRNQITGIEENSFEGALQISELYDISIFSSSQDIIKFFLQINFRKQTIRNPQ